MFVFFASPRLLPFAFSPLPHFDKNVRAPITHRNKVGADLGQVFLAVAGSDVPQPCHQTRVERTVGQNKTCAFKNSFWSSAGESLPFKNFKMASHPCSEKKLVSWRRPVCLPSAFWLRRKCRRDVQCAGDLRHRLRHPSDVRAGPQSREFWPDVWLLNVRNPPAILIMWGVELRENSSC